MESYVFVSGQSLCAHVYVCLYDYVCEEVDVVVLVCFYSHGGGVCVGPLPVCHRVCVYVCALLLAYAVFFFLQV